MKEVLNIINHTAKYDSSVVMALAVGKKKGTCRKNIRAKESRIRGTASPDGPHERPP